MAKSTLDIIPEQVELRPPLSSTGDVPRFLQQAQAVSETAENAETPETEEQRPATEETGGESGPAEPPSTEQAPAEQVETPAAPKPDPRTARVRAAEARAERLEAMLERALAALGQQQAPPSPPAPVEPPAPAYEPKPKPQRTAYSDPDAYETALAQWASEDATARVIADYESKQAARIAAQKAADEKAANDRAAAERAAAARQTFEDRRTKFIETHPDYEEIVEQDPTIFLQSKPGTPPVVYGIERSENGPEIAYWLAKNKDEMARLTSMTDPAEVMMEIGRISAKLAAPPPVRVSRTPAPIVPLGGNRPTTQRSLEEIGNEGSMEEYAARRRESPDMRPNRPGMWGGPRTVQ